MTDLEDAMQDILPIGGYADHDALESDVRSIVMAENPMGEAAEQGARYSGAIEDAALDDFDDLGDVSADELREAFEEWERVRSGLATRYRRRARYFEWEYRRAYLLEQLAAHASREFGAEKSRFADRHRITMEVRMWAAYAKHLLLDIESGDVSLADDEFGFIGIDTKHGINAAVMTSASLFESVGSEILVRNHDYDRDEHLSMDDINGQLNSRDYFGEAEYRLVDRFRDEVRNEIAHDILHRSRFDRYDDFRRDVIRPCWDVIGLAEALADDEIAPEE